MSRRELIAEAGIRLVAQRGMRGLTHLLVDAEAELPKGSTSYYARTRRDLITLVVQHLSEGSQHDIDGLAVPETLTRREAVSMTLAVLDQMQRRADAQAARFALLFELRHDDELRRSLTEDAPVRAPLIDTARAILAAGRVPNPEREAPELVALTDALLMYRTAGAPLDAEHILTTYFAGLPEAHDALFQLGDSLGWDGPESGADR